MIAQGPEPGVLYSATRRGGGGRWAGKVLNQVMGINDRQATQMISVWLKNGTLSETDFVHPTQRKTVTGLKVNDARRPS